MAIDKKLIDQLLTDYKKPEDIIGENGLLKELTKAILERALQAEMTDHLGYEKHDPGGHQQETIEAMGVLEERAGNGHRSGNASQCGVGSLRVRFAGEFFKVTTKVGRGELSYKRWESSKNVPGMVTGPGMLASVVSEV
jgi:putative transposase